MSTIWTNKRGHPRLYIPSASREKFNSLVSPYICESQQRKLFKSPAMFVTEKVSEKRVNKFKETIAI
jgi:hypothetical protein